jgi:hypothetical protein
MGVDIHGPFIEERVGDRWYGVATLSWYRTTSLFGILAGVRGGRPLVEPRGLPADAGTAWASHSEESARDCHTPSWLTRDELAMAYRLWKREVRAAEDEYDEIKPRHEGVEVALAVLDTLLDDYSAKDVRVGFCFDG